MKKFLAGVFTDKDGSPSSKRIVLFILLLTFIGCVLVNLIQGKMLSQVLSDQLFYLLIYALAAVFGENVTSLFKKKPQSFDGSKPDPDGRPDKP